MKESKKMMAKEVAFMKKGGMACGGKMKKYAAGGKVAMETVANKAVKGHEKRMHGMAKGGSVDGCAKKGKTKGKMV